VSDTEKKSFNILAEVVRIEELKKQWLYGLGVSFCRISEECRNLIKEYISNFSEKKEENISYLLSV